MPCCRKRLAQGDLPPSRRIKALVECRKERLAHARAVPLSDPDQPGVSRRRRTFDKHAEVPAAEGGDSHQCTRIQPCGMEQEFVARHARLRDLENRLPPLKAVADCDSGL